MLDDNIDKKIKDAAEQYHPSYYEDAWDKMELMLDKQLPVGKKRKRKYFLIPFFTVLLCGSLYLIYRKQGHSIANNSISTLVKNNIKPLKNNDTEALPIQQKHQHDKNINTALATPVNKQSFSRLAVAENHNSNATTENESEINGTLSSTISKKTGKKLSGKTGVSISAATISSDEYAIQNSKEIKSKDEPDNAKDVTSDNTIRKPQVIALIKDTSASETHNKTKTAKDLPVTKRSTTYNKSFDNNFSIDFSAGPDVSGIKLTQTGRIAINYGIGLGYALSSRFTLRSGFYISDKIYSADKGEYHTQSNGSPDLDYLYNIDANCKVFEIPLIFSYNFSKSANHQWFASAGLSSYLMKKESYDYYYKYPSGYSDYKSWSISNKNQHYVSILDVSAGYVYSFNKKASLLIEPYIKMPFSGVGAGKVKLNSGGVLFTLAVKPFGRK